MEPVLGPGTDVALRLILRGSSPPADGRARRPRLMLGLVGLAALLAGRFLVADDATSLATVMNRSVITIEPLESADAAARRVAQSGFAALPVVGEDGALLGAITFDAALRQVAPERWRRMTPRIFS